ncbi:MAG: molybdenum cofactor guanylyltransferase [Planctomycetes bacterium]|nr:molybdenum cofactor guanylyltransferase [Planctomycetota bacterium]
MVLCGGRSSRMGADKARLELDGRSLLEHALAALDAVAAPVVLACGPSARYADLGRALAPDRVADAGPLAGIEAGLAAVPSGYVCVLAVDLPRVRAAHLARLLERAVADDLDACLARSASGPEPLCGVYHTRLLPRIRGLLDQGARKVTSVLDVPLAQHPLPRHAWLDDGLADGAASNLNTPTDLETERARRARIDSSRKAAS